MSDRSSSSSSDADSADYETLLGAIVDPAKAVFACPTQLQAAHSARNSPVKGPSSGFIFYDEWEGKRAVSLVNFRDGNLYQDEAVRSGIWIPSAEAIEKLKIFSETIDKETSPNRLRKLREQSWKVHFTTCVRIIWEDGKVENEAHFDVDGKFVIPGLGEYELMTVCGEVREEGL